MQSQLSHLLKFTPASPAKPKLNLFIKNSKTSRFPHPHSMQRYSNTSSLKKYKTLNSPIQNRSSSSIFTKRLSKANILKTQRNKNEFKNSISSRQTIKINLKINEIDIRFDSHAVNVQCLLKQIKDVINSRGIYLGQFSLETIDNNLSINYLLTIKQYKFQGRFKQLNIRPFILIPSPIISINSFQIIRAIGSGGFSNVYLVRFKQNGNYYALKAINKEFIVKHRKHKLIMNQRNIMAQIHHPLHAKLQWAFQSKNYLNFVLDYYPGGQLFGLIRKVRKITESAAKFYIIQILIALQKLHNCGIIYRDIKPQNILLDIHGHVYLADFGLSKPGIKDQNTRAYSFCGSPQYMPPQIISKSGHSFTADFYSLGALLYQLITGLPPFYNRDPQKIYRATLNQQLAYPPHLSPQLKNLLQGLLCKDQNLRLGSQWGVKQILIHPWFGKFNLSSYLDKSIQTPFNFLQPEKLTFNKQDMSKTNDDLIQMIKNQQNIQQKFNIILNNFYYSRPIQRNSMKKNISRSQLYSRKKSRDTSFRKQKQNGLLKSMQKMIKLDNFI